MIAFIDAPATIEDHHGHHLLTFKSGAAEIQVLLTRHVLFALLAHCAKAAREANEAESPVRFRPVLPKGKAK